MMDKLVGFIVVLFYGATPTCTRKVEGLNVEKEHPSKKKSTSAAWKFRVSV